MPNYGDCALSLPANWDRFQYENQEWLLTMVGHSGGVADAYLKDNPDAEHQFYWADVLDKFSRDVMLAQQRGYVFCAEGDGWVKHPQLWDWDAQRRITFGGLVLMARPKARWEAEQQRRNVLNDKARESDSRDVDEHKAFANGLVPTEAVDSMRRKRVRPPRANVAF